MPASRSYSALAAAVFARGQHAIDPLTHVGQIALLRRLAEAPIRPENYSVAKIEAGRVGSKQNAPVAEF